MVVLMRPGAPPPPVVLLQSPHPSLVTFWSALVPDAPVVTRHCVTMCTWDIPWTPIGTFTPHVALFDRGATMWQTSTCFDSVRSWLTRLLAEYDIVGTKPRDVVA